MNNCINCNINVTRLLRHNLSSQSDEVRQVIHEWMDGQTVDQHTLICDACLRLAIEALIDRPGTSRPDRGVGHRHVCVCCGQSLLRQRSHSFSSNSAQDLHIMNVVTHRIRPRQLRSTDIICHRCWLQCTRAASPPSPGQNASPTVSEGNTETNQSEDNISQMSTIVTLPDYRRAVDTQSHCFFPECNMSDRHVVPYSLRVWLFQDFSYYVPQNCKICSHHLNSNSWDVLSDNEIGIHQFTVSHIQDFASFVSCEVQPLDFENIHSMNEYMAWYFLGMNTDQFRCLIREVPRIADMYRGATGLGAYLIKLRTGDSDDRISKLLQVPRSTLERLMNNVREKLHQDFVPMNLGIEHISREQIAQRNLVIPNGLFCEDERKPIAIVDGTYIYVQKSSNYLYQKKTYSLHKYRNLVKPLMIVSCDGYIIEILGPYPATTSDATIMVELFGDPNNALRQYFQAGDVFILDRGFRDSIPLLESCNYSVHVPSTLEDNESQLSTLEANKSRKVTICRWIVEAVNGIFKQQFKIFRQEYFNRATTHLMIDFSIAGALINRFHTRVIDRVDAAEILQVINDNMFVENSLADYVISHNLNRRRAQFQTINVDSTNIADFPQLTINELILIACGTYQIKQARSYYGEHRRANGLFQIEVTREMDGTLLEDLGLSDSCWLLRGKIKSRHISQKIYFVYIIVNNSLSGRAAVQHRYCNCIVGRRTVGTCAHVMTIIWYLGWARYQSNIYPPAQFLDDILVIINTD